MDIYVKENIFVLRFEKKVDFTLTSIYNRALSLAKNEKFQIINLDLALTKFVTLPGAMYILLLISEIVSVKKRNRLHVESRLTNYSGDVILSLANFGLISMLKIYGNLNNTDSYISSLSIERYDFWQKAIKSSQILPNLYWPISPIPLKTHIGYLESISYFYNNFNDYFTKLSTQNRFDSLDSASTEIRSSFIKAVNESTKNVWDHSESWGIASMQSTKTMNTTFCLFDLGIGFINSYIKRLGKYERSVESDKKVLMWLLEEGNTSNEANNHGHGLAIIRKFTNITNGYLLINTDKYTIRFNKKTSFKIEEKQYFPGTQIMINF